MRWDLTIFGADVGLLGDLALGHQLLLGLGGGFDEGRGGVGNGLGRLQDHLVKVHLLIHHLWLYGHNVTQHRNSYKLKGQPHEIFAQFVFSPINAASGQGGAGKSRGK